ncbi:MAG: transcription elongation factor GreA [Chloroflexota bacterium]
MSETSVSLNTAVSQYLALLTPQERDRSQQEIYRFVRWFGGGKPVTSLGFAEIVGYAEQLSASAPDYEKKLELVRAFLRHTEKKGWAKKGLAGQLRARKVKTTRTQPTKNLPAFVPLSREGYAEMKLELESLKAQQLQVIEDIRRAAADKDLSENAPYHAARERKSRLDGRIMELEETLKIAQVIDEHPKSSQKADLGDTVVLRNLNSGEELTCTLVNPREVSPSERKISCASPIGKAIVGHGEGETVEITAPAGKLCYRIEKLKR